jgi:hypothetical protein
MSKYDIRNRNDQMDKQLDVKFTVNQSQTQSDGCQRFKFFIN